MSQKLKLSATEKVALVSRLKQQILAAHRSEQNAWDQAIEYDCWNELDAALGPPPKYDVSRPDTLALVGIKPPPNEPRKVLHFTSRERKP
jgi:hypothetical protein